MTWRSFRIWLFYSILLQLALVISVFFWDFFAGTKTEGFGVLKPYYGLPMFYVYMIGLFTGYLTMTPILRSNHFGIGFFVWLPYATIGVVVEIYFEVILDPVLKSYWCTLGYGALGLLAGFTADLLYQFLSKNTSYSKEKKAGICGTALNLVYFLGILIALAFFYKRGSVIGSFNIPNSFLGVAYFGLPWLLFHGFLGGYLAGIHETKVTFQ